MRSTALFTLALLALAACTTFIEAEDTKPAVTGEWTGRWESAGHQGHGGLKCVAVEAGNNTWKATFTAEFGRVKDYKIELTGKLDGKKVVFGGEVNIGTEAGEGVFKWSGSADEKEFVGVYEGGGDKGTFKMTRPEKKQDK